MVVLRLNQFIYNYILSSYTYNPDLKRKSQIVSAIQKRTGIKIEIWAASSIKKLLDKLKIKDYKETPKSKLPQLPKDY